MDISMFAFDEQPVPHLVYDLSLPLEDRRENAIMFRSAHAAANWLGIPPNRMYKVRVPGHKVQRKQDGKWYAVRIAPKAQ